MTLATSVLERAGESLGNFLPQLLGALALLLIGLLLARLLGRAVRRALQAAGLDDVTLARAGLKASLSAVIDSGVSIIVSVIVIFAALTLLGLEPLSQSLNEAVLFLPNVLVALALVLAGVILAGLVREWVDRVTYQMDFPVPLGQLAQAATLALFVITAAAQIGVDAAILTLVLGILLAAVAATFAIAFGLGGREVALALNAGRFVRASFTVGETISVGDLRGQIVGIETDATVIRTADGRVRVPNHMLVESVVTIHGESPRSDGPGA